MTSRAAALLAISLAACGTGEPAAAPVADPAPTAERPAPAAERTPIEEAIEAAARWRAIPPPAEAASFDPDAFEWRVLSGMEQLAQPSGERVTIVARSGGGGTGCGGTMCSMGLEARVLRGTLSSDRLGYFATDRPPNHHLCEGGSSAGLFQEWTIAEIAPRSSDRSDPLYCGVSVGDDDDREDWVILRVATTARSIDHTPR